VADVEGVVCFGEQERCRVGESDRAFVEVVQGDVPEGTAFDIAGHDGAAVEELPVPNDGTDDAADGVKERRAAEQPKGRGVEFEQDALVVIGGGCLRV